MQQQLEELLIDMRDAADYTSNKQLEYFSERLEEIIKNNY